MIRHDRRLEKSPAWKRAARAWLAHDRDKQTREDRHAPKEVVFRYSRPGGVKTSQNPATRGMTMIVVIETVCACGIVERNPEAV